MSKSECSRSVTALALGKTDNTENTFPSKAVPARMKGATD